jgi:hypothetical protein
MASKETVPQSHSPHPQSRSSQETLYCSDPDCEYCKALKKTFQEMRVKPR